MLCVTDVFLIYVINVIFPILHLNVSFLSICFSGLVHAMFVLQSTKTDILLQISKKQTKRSPTNTKVIS